jgi:hypothetical protein
MFSQNSDFSPFFKTVNVIKLKAENYIFENKPAGTQ